MIDYLKFYRTTGTGALVYRDGMTVRDGTPFRVVTGCKVSAPPLAKPPQLVGVKVGERLKRGMT
jgi:hypothetical protein